MKLLSITSVFPYPLKTGGHKAQFFMLDSLKENIKIDLFCSRSETQEIEIALRKRWKGGMVLTFNRERFPKVKGKRKINFTTLLRRLAIPFKWQREISHLSPYLPRLFSGFEKTLQKYLVTNSYDLIQCEFVPCLGLGKMLPQRMKKVFIHHEISFVCVERTLDTLNWWSKTLLQYQSSQKKRVELEMLRDFDGIIVFSQIDKEKLSRYISPSKLYVSPFAIATKDFKNVNKNFSFKKKLLFMGGSVHYPNVDGLNWFLEKIWDSSLNVEVDILGQWKEDIVKRYRSILNVHFQGFVPSINEFMEGSILIVPLRIGSGIRTKILEAFAAGVPVITTSVGVEGIEIKNGVHCLIADTPEDFISNINLLISDAQMQTKLSKNARNFVQEYYSIEKCTKQREHVLRQISRL